MNKTTLRLASRGSPLALAQAELTAAFLKQRMPSVSVEIVKIETRGDVNLSWSLEKQGGSGLFTIEVERAVREGSADIAVHSAKDLPSRDSEGMAVAGYLPRANPLDILVVRENIQHPATIATGSPRRRAQAQRMFPKTTWSEIRGNVNTRLNKIAQGTADATFLAAAGLERLGISGYGGLIFKAMRLEEMVPAAGQGAIALQTTQANAERYREIFCQETAHAVGIERRFLARLGIGCHSAFAVHWTKGHVWFFQERMQQPHSVPFAQTEEDDINFAVDALIEEYELAYES